MYLEQKSSLFLNCNWTRTGLFITGLCTDVGGTIAGLRSAALDPVGGTEPLDECTTRQGSSTFVPAVLHGLPRPHQRRLLLLQNAARCSQVRSHFTIHFIVFKYYVIRHTRYLFIISSYYYSVT